MTADEGDPASEWDEPATGWDADEAARAYAAEAFSSLLAVLGEQPLDGSRVIDFGCGTGLLTERLVANGASVYAVDSSSAMLAVLDAKVSEHGWSGVVTGRAVSSDMSNVDLIVCSSVCAFLDDYPGTFAVVARGRAFRSMGLGADRRRSARTDAFGDRFGARESGPGRRLRWRRLRSRRQRADHAPAHGHRPPTGVCVYAMRIVSVCGSPGEASSNLAALRHAQAHIETLHPAIEWVEASLGGIPVFDPRLADSPPSAVKELSGQFQSADGLLIAAPEYAGGLSGGTKTALDWMVGLSSLYHRPTAILSAGTTGGVFALEQLVRTLSWQGALVVKTLGVQAPRTKIDEFGHIFDEDLQASVEQWADGLVSAVEAEPAALLAMVDTVVSPFGIDVARFGDLS